MLYITPVQEGIKEKKNRKELKRTIEMVYLLYCVSSLKYKKNKKSLNQLFEK